MNQEKLQEVFSNEDFVKELLAKETPEEVQEMLAEKDIEVTIEEIKEKYSCIDKIELLPFKKICQTKYDSMNIEFPFAHIDTPSKEIMDKLNNLLSLAR